MFTVAAPLDSHLQTEDLTWTFVLYTNIAAIAQVMFYCPCVMGRMTHLLHETFVYLHADLAGENRQFSNLDTGVKTVAAPIQQANFCV